MTNSHKLSVLLLVTVMVATVRLQAAEPWEETQLSRDLRAWQERDVNLRTNKELDHYFGMSRYKPNLYDLHHPEGALAVAVRKDVNVFIQMHLVLKILEAAELPVRTIGDDMITYYDGKQRRLWLLEDKTPLELPATRFRQALPFRIGIISMNTEGKMRASDGRSMSTPIKMMDTVAFAANWAYFAGVRDRAPIADMEAGIRVEFRSDEVLVDSKPVAVANIAREVAQTLKAGTSVAKASVAFHLEPSADVSYGRVVEVLDQIYRVSNHHKGPGILIGLPSRPARKISLAEEPAIMVLKVDSAASFEKVDAILKQLAMVTDRVALLTHLDVTDHDVIEADTYPGGLPGGIILPLARTAEREK